MQRQGLEITLATGRDYKDALAISQKAGLTTHIISSNGTSVHTVDGRNLFTSGIELGVVKSMLEWLEERQYYYEVTADDWTYTPAYSRQYLENELRYIQDNCPEVMKELELELNKLLRPIGRVERYEDLFADNKAYQNILVFSPDKNRLAAGAAFFKAMPELNVVSSLDHNIEMNAKSASKGAALKVLAGELSISLDKTLAMGDNYNDISMFQSAKYSIAMGNAKTDIKACCSFVTLSNDEDGVAHALDNIISPMISKRTAAYNAFVRINKSYMA
jgi:Cof subfamily protein (haloacid dehalogenase superfamily)